jgi:Family of unknown function (DUF5519)
VPPYDLRGSAAGHLTGASSNPRRRNPINDELLEVVEREVLSRPGVSKETGGGGAGQGGFWVPPATVYSFGRRHIGHIHQTGVADLTFPRESHDELISDGRAKPHPAGFANVVSCHIRELEDVPRVVELLRISYERTKASAEQHRKRIELR